MGVDWTYQMLTVVVKSRDKSDDLYNVCNWMKAEEEVEEVEEEQEKKEQEEKEQERRSMREEKEENEEEKDEKEEEKEERMSGWLHKSMLQHCSKAAGTEPVRTWLQHLTAVLYLILNFKLNANVVTYLQSDRLFHFAFLNVS